MNELNKQETSLEYDDDFAIRDLLAIFQKNQK